MLERSRIDLQLAFDRQHEAGMLEKIGTHPLGELLQALGDVNSRLGRIADAEKYYALLQTKLPNTEYATRASAWLTTKQPLPVTESGCIGCHRVTP
jgi:hypothetical protein